jgi:hypothetical protein
MIRVGTHDETTTIHVGTDDDMMTIRVGRRSAASLSTATMPEMVGGMDEDPIAVGLAIVPGGETAMADQITTGNVEDDVIASITHASTISTGFVGKKFRWCEEGVGNNFSFLDTL